MNLLMCRKGQGLIEYLLIIGLVIILVVGIIRLIGDENKSNTRKEIDKKEKVTIGK